MDGDPFPDGEQRQDGQASRGTRPQAERNGRPEVDDEQEPNRNVHGDQRIAVPGPDPDPKGHLHHGDRASDAAALAEALLGHLRQVTEHYAELFEGVADPPDGTARLDFSGPDPPPATLIALAEMGFSNPAAMVATIRTWQAGRPRALRSQRARELMGEVLPHLLAAVARQAQPDVVFTRFDAFLGRLPTGVQPLSLFQHNPALLDRVAAVLGAAPSLADHLANVPSALEALLVPEKAPSPARLLRSRLRDACVLEDAIVAMGRIVREEDFRISVATMEGRLDADASGIARTALADAALTLLRDESKRKRMGEWARARALEVFAPERNVHLVENVYARLGAKRA